MADSTALSARQTGTFLRRADALACASERDGGPWDVLVIGGGIVGAGVARDAAMRGLRVVLVEQRDLASGTSSRSSRLLHGGLRYLAHGWLGLVRQANTEKKVVRQIAPHLVHPLPFVFPAPVHGPWKLWKLRVGVRLYDWLCGSENFGPSCGMSRRELAESVPQLRHDNFRGAVRYYDALTNDARLVVDTCRSAAAHGAVVLNYVRAGEIRREGGIWTAELEDRLTGKTFGLSARTVVNACGPWADRWPQAGCKLRLTKGVHLVVDRSRLHIEQAVVMTSGQRILFAIPWGRRVILGTTDSEYRGDLEEPPCEPDDIACVLEVVNETFPGAGLSAADVLSTWSGLRPLVWSREGRPSEVPRNHQICMPQPGWFDVTGGKLTTYRLMAEHTVDRLTDFMGRSLSPCRTALEPLLAGRGDAAFSCVVPPDPGEECVQHCCANEWAVHLEDVMIRRTSWMHYFPEETSLPARVATWMARTLDWDAQRTRVEIDDYLQKERAARPQP